MRSSPDVLQEDCECTDGPNPVTHQLLTPPANHLVCTSNLHPFATTANTQAKPLDPLESFERVAHTSGKHTVLDLLLHRAFLLECIHT
jgi:hypothetical protein